MSALLAIRTGATTGLGGLSAELLAAERKASRTLLSKAGTILARKMREKLSSRGGPSRPGDPPARVTGQLRSVIGKDRPRRRGETMSVLVGVGVGKAKERKALELKGQGHNMWAVGALHERGGIGAAGRRYPARSFARRAEEEAEAEIVALFEGGA